MTDKEKGRSTTKKIAPDTPQSNRNDTPATVDPLVLWFRLGRGVKAKPKTWRTR